MAATSHAGLSMVARPRALAVLDAAFALCFPVPVMLDLSLRLQMVMTLPHRVLSCTAHSRPYLAPYWDGEAGGD